jgi:hypothetical protein
MASGLGPEGSLLRTASAKFRDAASIVDDNISASPPEYDVVIIAMYHTRFNRTG